MSTFKLGMPRMSTAFQSLFIDPRDRDPRQREARSFIDGMHMMMCQLMDRHVANGENAGTNENVLTRYFIDVKGKTYDVCAFTPGIRNETVFMLHKEFATLEMHEQIHRNVK